MNYADGAAALSPSSCQEGTTPSDGLPISLPDGEISEQRGATRWGVRLWGFDYDTATLRPAHIAHITELKDTLNANTAVREWMATQVVGHASPEGEENYNQGLALNRAQAAVTELGRGIPTSSGETCAQNVSADEYPYYRAVDLTIDLVAESEQAPNEPAPNGLCREYYDAWIMYNTGVAMAWQAARTEEYQVPDSPNLWMMHDEDWRMGMKRAGLGDVDPDVLHAFYRGATSKEEGARLANEEVRRLTEARTAATSDCDYAPPWENSAYTGRSKSQENRKYRQ